MEIDHLLQQLGAAVLFGAVGIALYSLAYFAIRKTVHFSIEKELAEDQNVALGIVLGCMMLGIALIVAAAIHG